MVVPCILYGWLHSESMKLSEYAEREGIKYRAAYNRFKAGKITGAFQNEHGRIVIPDPQEELRGRAAIYARVSSPGQKDDLERQVERLKEFATARGLVIDQVVAEVASGVKDDRPKLTRLLTTNADSWGTLIVEHKDRLTRVGFQWFPTLLGVQGKDILVANEAADSDEGRMQDIFSILYSYAASEYGRRGAKNRAERAARELSADG